MTLNCPLGLQGSPAGLRACSPDAHVPETPHHRVGQETLTEGRTERLNPTCLARLIRSGPDLLEQPIHRTVTQHGTRRGQMEQYELVFAGTTTLKASHSSIITITVN